MQVLFWQAWEKDKMGIELIVDETRIEFKKELVLKVPNPLDTQHECLPEKIEKGKFYKFLINGYKIFPLGKTIQLLIDGEEISKPLANIQITEQTAFLLAGTIKTRGELCYWSL